VPSAARPVTASRASSPVVPRREIEREIGREIEGQLEREHALFIDEHVADRGHDAAGAVAERARRQHAHELYALGEPESQLELIGHDAAVRERCPGDRSIRAAIGSGT